MKHHPGEEGDSITWSTNEETGTSQDPKLTVVHEATPQNPPTVLEARKSANQSIAQSTVLEDDDHLLLTSLATSTTYSIEGVIFASSTSATPDLKIAFSTPTGSRMNIGYIAASAGNFHYAEWLNTVATTSVRIPIVASDTTIIHISGTITTSASPQGDFMLRWAQFTANASPTTVMEGSFL